MDVLSEVLKVVRLNGAVFYNAEFSAPWSVRSPQSLALAPYVRCDGGHVVIYHLVTDGAAWARLETAEQRVQLAAGDIVIFPHGDPHLMGHGSSVGPIDNGKHLETLFSQGLNVMRMGGGGEEQTKFLCGYLACDTQLKDLLLGSLPPILKVNIRSDPSGAWLENSIRFSVRMPPPRRPAEKLYSRNYRRRCSLRRCAGISRQCRRTDRLARWRAGRRGRQSAGPLTSQSGAALDDC